MSPSKKIATALNVRLFDSEDHHNPLRDGSVDDLPPARRVLSLDESGQNGPTDWDLCSLEAGLSDVTLMSECEAEVVHPPPAPKLAKATAQVLSIPDSWTRILR